MKVALVDDWLTSFTGKERVTFELHRLFPEAPIYTSVYNPETAPQFEGADIRTSFIQKMPLARRKHQFFPLLRRRAFESFDLSGYDLVISSSGAEAKGVITKPPTVHINYCHSPTHYYWSNYQEYLENPGFGALDPAVRLGLKATIKRSRRWDLAAAARPDHMIANSSHIQKMIRKYYHRDSIVIFPPVDTAAFEPKSSGKDRNGFIIVGRQATFKRIDLAVRACTQLGLDLTVVGNGPEHSRLRRLAGPTISFRTDVDDREKIELLQSHAGFIFPNEEDFGIAPVEAMAAGCPVIALRSGGALDTVVDGVSGIFFDHQNVTSLSHALQKFEDQKFLEKDIRAQARKFSTDRFRDDFQKLISTL